MTTEYRTVCDRCGKETRGWDDKGQNEEIAKNNWDVQVYTHWLDGTDDPSLKEYRTSREFEATACGDCAKVLAAALREAMKK